MRCFFLVCLVVGLAGCTHHQVNNAMEAAATSALLADWAQTRDIAECAPHACHENNPILGRNPSKGRVDLYFAGATLANFGVNRWLAQKPPWYRTSYNLMILAVESVCVINNNQLGFRFNLD